MAKLKASEVFDYPGQPIAMTINGRLSKKKAKNDHHPLIKVKKLLEKWLANTTGEGCHCEHCQEVREALRIVQEAIKRGEKVHEV